MTDTTRQSLSSASEGREVCRFFLHGVCRFGDTCYYSHDQNLLSKQPRAVCKYYLAGSCSFGDQCFNEHVRPKPVTISTNSLETDSSSSEANSASTSPASVGEVFLLDSYKEKSSKAGEDLKSGRNKTELCPYYLKNSVCPYETSCDLVHGNVCDMCDLACLNPFDEAQRNAHKIECMKILEQEMEEAFAVQRSSEKACGICMEVVWEKEKDVDRRFGILENCNHVFCLACIRQWRSSKFENKVCKACPECRVKSDFVTPNKFWFEDDASKKKIIQEYKHKLGQTSCKYFKEGDGKCPFGNKCFYLHRYKDGSIAVLPEPTRRRRLNRHHLFSESYSGVVTVDFDFSDDEEDDFDILEFFRHSLLWDNNDTSDSDISDLFELSNEVLI